MTGAARAALGIVAGVCLAGPAPAQRPLARAAGLGGVEGRQVRFESLPSARRVRQVSIPVGAVLPLGRVTLDVGTAWASTELLRPDGTRHEVSDFIDTQLRGSVTLGRDAVVATLLVNLPTGPADASPSDYSVIGAVSPSFLGFPVPAYASGFSVTGGLAAAVQAGAWSLGLAGSIRVSDEYTPYRDAAGPITYRPGVEGRLRAGADGLIGSSRLTLGTTFSTLGSDQFGEGGAATGEYRPGKRVIVEASFLAPVGGSTLSIAVWDYFRAAGDTSRVSAANRENLAGGQVGMSIPVGRSVTLEPEIQARLFDPEAGEGRSVGAGLGVGLRAGEVFTLVPAARYDWGWVSDRTGLRSDLTGWWASVFLRITP